MEIHKDDLMANWELAVSGQNIFKIDPLKQIMINPRVKSVKPLNDYRLKLFFDNNEVKIFDVNPYLNIGVFVQLKDESIFNSVRPFLGSVQWCNGLDLDPDTLYLDSLVVEKINSGNN